MKKAVFAILTVATFVSGYFTRGYVDSLSENGGIPTETLDNTFPDLSIYSIKSLGNFTDAGEINIQESILKNEKYESNVFNLTFKPNPNVNERKKITGQINIPTSNSANQNNKYPLIIMLRGYINQETYLTGDGTRSAAGYFAENGFITIAPDFLGYGDSDSESGNIFESRFQTYTTVLSLIKSLPEIKKWDQKHVFIWAHSNGGHIALIILEVTGKNYPTTLWAPVTKPFPYSVLYYTDQSEDGGRLIRTKLAEFEKQHLVEDYSLTNFLDKINAPLSIHQGLNDEAVPYKWSSDFVNTMKSLGKEINYYSYPETDHNMRPVWDSVIQSDLEFFKSYL